MSKPSLYLPSKPLKYELKRQLIPTDVLIGPVILISLKNGYGKASCRSIEGLNIFDMLKEHQTGLSGEFMSQQLGVSSRTIRSDIKALQEYLVEYDIT